MGILAEQKEEEVQKAAPSLESKEKFERTPPKPEDISRVEEPPSKESVVEPIFEPTQIVETTNKSASGNLVNQSDSVRINIVPKIEQEVYSFDILNENLEVVYSVNSHSGAFKSQIPLPKGNYTYFIKTQRDDMPFSVSFEF